MSGIKVERTVHFTSGRQSQKKMREGKSREPAAPRVPRVAKLMALAIREVERSHLAVICPRFSMIAGEGLVATSG